tara:strand:- start:486 stop:722 length:237 start_codon:yes stop_codon:yes gene_type:complete
MIKDWSVEEILSQIDKIAINENDPYMDGFNTWGCKKDLYQIFWYAQEKLMHCSTYAGEEEFIKEYEKKRVWQELKRKI